MTHYIYAIIGPSGVGKSTITDAVFKKTSQIVSFTSRDPRPGEKEGVDYYFIGKKSPQQIEQMRQDCYDGKLVELVEYNNNVYGYATNEILSKFDPKSKSAAAIVTLEGYFNLKQSQFGDYIIPVFVYASRDTIKKHLEKRNDTPDNILKRLSLYESEAKNKEWFDKLDSRKIFISTELDDISTIAQNFKAKISQYEKD